LRALLDVFIHQLEKKIKAILADREKVIAENESAEESANAPMDRKRLKKRVDKLNNA